MVTSLLTRIYFILEQIYNEAYECEFHYFQFQNKMQKSRFFPKYLDEETL